MKKAATLCMAAMLTIGASATAYAAPCGIQAILQNGKLDTSILCNEETLKETLKEKLEACLPNFSFPSLPSFPSVPDMNRPETEKPETEKPETEKPETEKPETEKPETEKPETNQGVSAYAARVVELVNEERAKAGLSALKLDLKASQAAQVRAEEIGSHFSHTRPDGRSCYTALKEAGVSYRAAGENIAKGQKTPEAVVTAWMNSAGHRANILSENFTAIGVGYVEGCNCWSQFFIG